MSLATAFATSKNLGVLTEAWLRHVRAILKAKPADIGVKLQLDNAASVVAPAALVATVVRDSGLAHNEGIVRVLLLGTDPLIRFDKSRWASMAGELLGRPGCVEIVLTADEDANSEFSKLATALELPACRVVSRADAVAGEGRFDLAIWVHPATETRDKDEALNMNSALAMAGELCVPTYTASFNELDLHAQNYLIHEKGWKLTPLGGSISRGAPSINRFGIATADLGLEGGWAAILGKLEPEVPKISPADIALVRTAMRLVCAEGALNSSWSLGQRVNGVAFNRIIPVGLLGNMAIDPQTGHVFTHDDQSKELQIIGHLWSSMLDTLPTGKKDLLLWASAVKLAFLAELPKEDARRKEAIETLEEGFSDGVMEAGVALARCYEKSKTEESAAKSQAWYVRVGDRHPLSAYSMAYARIESDDLVGAEQHFRIAANSGYPVALTDLGKLLCTVEREEEGLQCLERAAALRDSEANYELGELSAKAGQFQEALDYLKKAWSYGHAEAAALAAQVAAYMLEHGVGKRSLIKREIKEIADYQRKLDRRLVKNAV